MSSFISHKESPLLISTLQKGWHFLHALGLAYPHIQIRDELHAQFARLKGQRTIICPNHPSPQDALVLFALSALFDERFAFLAARDVFGKSGSFQEKWLQMLGCYSVSRGTADVQAFKESCRILKENKNKLVIFPEGEISYYNATLRRFHSGPELIALSTLHELKNKGNNDPVYLLPVALRYKFSSSAINDQLSAALESIEKKLASKSADDESFASRLHRIYSELIASSPASSMNGSFAHLCESRIANVEKVMQKDHSAEKNPIRRIHLLMNEVAELRNSGPKENLLAEKCYRELKKIIPFLGIAETNFDHEFSTEELADLLRPLLDEFQTGIRIPYPDTVEISACEPVCVAAFLPESSQERKEKLEGLTAILKSNLEDRLAQMECENRLSMKEPHYVT